MADLNSSTLYSLQESAPSQKCAENIVDISYPVDPLVTSRSGSGESECCKCEEQCIKGTFHAKSRAGNDASFAWAVLSRCSIRRARPELRLRARGRESD